MAEPMEVDDSFESSPAQRPLENTSPRRPASTSPRENPLLMYVTRQSPETKFLRRRSPKHVPDSPDGSQSVVGDSNWSAEESVVDETESLYSALSQLSTMTASSSNTFLRPRSVRSAPPGDSPSRRSPKSEAEGRMSGLPRREAVEEDMPGLGSTGTARWIGRMLWLSLIGLVLVAILISRIGPSAEPPALNPSMQKLRQFLSKEIHDQEEALNALVRQLEDFIQHGSCRVVALVGPSGVGKTKTLELLGQFLEASTSRTWWGGEASELGSQLAPFNNDNQILGSLLTKTGEREVLRYLESRLPMFWFQNAPKVVLTLDDMEASDDETLAGINRFLFKNCVPGTSVSPFRSQIFLVLSMFEDDISLLTPYFTGSLSKLSAWRPDALGWPLILSSAVPKELWEFGEAISFQPLTREGIRQCVEDELRRRAVSLAPAELEELVDSFKPEHGCKPVHNLLLMP